MGKAYQHVIMENEKVELKEFQDEPSADLADEIYELSKRARLVYGEKIVSEFLATQSFLYRTGSFRTNIEMVEAMMKQQQEQEQINEIDFTKEPIQ